MDRKEQLEFCKICHHRSFDLKQGIICGLTGERAAFDEACPHFSPEERVTVPEEKEDDISFRELLRFFGNAIRLKFFVTPLLILGSITMFFLSLKNSPALIIPMDTRLMELGALVKSMTVNGEYWRLLTYQFLHADIEHLATNVLGLFPIGFLLERMIGSFRIAIAYLVSGIAAGACSILFDDLGVTVGASGSILGLYGLYVVLLTARIMDRKTRLIILVGLAGYLVLTLLNSFRDGIDIAAHAGGIIGGLILGLGMRFFYVQMSHRFYPVLTTFSAVILSLLATSGIVLSAPDTENRFDAKIKEFSMNEQEARRMMYEYGPRNVNLYVSIVNRSIVPTWEKCKRIINESMEIEGVTEEMLEHAEEMIEYCNLSAKWCQLDAYSRKLGLHDHEIMLEYCEELLATMMTMHIDSAARDTLVYENSFSALLQRIPGDRAIVLDGKPVQDLKELEAMDPLEVVTIRIFHHAMSERMYGRYGRNGVVEMKTLRKIREDVSGMPDGPDKRELMSLYGMKP